MCIRDRDLIDGISIAETVDDATGISSKSVTDWKSLAKNSDLKPRITLRNEKGEVIKKADGNVARYYLVPDTILSVKDGQKVNAGDVLARLPKETSKTKDITGGLPRVAELFEARRPKDSAIIAENDGVIEFGKEVRGKQKVSIVKTQSAGADYTDHAAGHWINDTIISNPMSVYNDYQHSRSAWGMDVLKGIFIEVTTESGHQGYATAYGGYISSWIIKNHLNRFLIGADARNLSKLYDQMYRASIPYSGQNGVVINTIAGIDLALWDLIGKVRQEPVYMMIGGKVRDKPVSYTHLTLPTNREV